MERLQDGIRAATYFPKPRSVHPASGRAPKIRASESMTRKLVVLREEQPIAQAIDILVRRGISGAPVLNGRGRLVGVLSELDCMRMVTSGAFHQEELVAACRVGDLMTEPEHTVAPDEDIYTVAHLFIRDRVRRLLVIDNGELVGLISRRDVLRAMRRWYG